MSCLGEHLRSLWVWTLLVPCLATADDAAMKQPPRVAMCLPLAVAPGVKTKVVVRGWRLDLASGVSLSPAQGSVQLLAAGKAVVPDKQDPKRLGDTQVEIEVELPPETPPGTVSVVVATPEGQTAPHDLLVGGSFHVLLDREPNDGFREAQKLELPQIVDGAIQNNLDVDVFVLEGSAGQSLICETLAARHGSACDAVLSLYDDRGTMIAVGDDSAGSVDAHLEVTLPAAGRYYLCLSDANDQGGPTHPYRLVVRKP